MNTEEVKELVQDVNAGKISPAFARRILSMTNWTLQYDYDAGKYVVQSPSHQYQGA